MRIDYILLPPHSSPVCAFVRIRSHAIILPMPNTAIHEPPASAGCIRWLAALTALLAVIELGAAGRALQTPPDLAAKISLPMPLEFAASAIWGLLAALVTVAFVRRSPRALRYTASLLIGFTLYSLTRLLLFAQADYDRQRLPLLFALAVVILFIPTSFALRSTKGTLQPTEIPGNGRKPED